MFGLYVPGVSERLQILVARNGVRNWYFYTGKLQEKFAGFKENIRKSKSQNTVYTVACNAALGI